MHILEVGGSSKRDIEWYSQDAKSSSVVPDAGGDTLVKKRIIGSYPRGGHNRFTHCPNDHTYEVFNKRTTVNPSEV